MQFFLAIAILLLVLAFSIRKYYRVFSGKQSPCDCGIEKKEVSKKHTCSCGCPGCPHTQTSKK